MSNIDVEILNAIDDIETSIIETQIESIFNVMDMYRKELFLLEQTSSIPDEVFFNEFAIFTEFYDSKKEEKESFGDKAKRNLNTEFKNGSEDTKLFGRKTKSGKKEGILKGILLLLPRLFSGLFNLAFKKTTKEEIKETQENAEKLQQIVAQNPNKVDVKINQETKEATIILGDEQARKEATNSTTSERKSENKDAVGEVKPEIPTKQSGVKSEEKQPVPEPQQPVQQKKKTSEKGSVRSVEADNGGGTQVPKNQPPEEKVQQPVKTENKPEMGEIAPPNNPKQSEKQESGNQQSNFGLTDEAYKQFTNTYKDILRANLKGTDNNVILTMMGKLRSIPGVTDDNLMNLCDDVHKKHYDEIEAQLMKEDSPSKKKTESKTGEDVNQPESEKSSDEKQIDRGTNSETFGLSDEDYQKCVEYYKIIQRSAFEGDNIKFGKYFDLMSNIIVTPKGRKDFVSYCRSKYRDDIKDEWIKDGAPTTKPSPNNVDEKSDQSKQIQQAKHDESDNFGISEDGLRELIILYKDLTRANIRGDYDKTVDKGNKFWDKFQGYNFDSDTENNLLTFLDTKYGKPIEKEWKDSGGTKRATIPDEIKAIVKEADKEFRHLPDDEKMEDIMDKIAIALYEQDASKIENVVNEMNNKCAELEKDEFRGAREANMWYEKFDYVYNKVRNYVEGQNGRNMKRTHADSKPSEQAEKAKEIVDKIKPSEQAEKAKEIVDKIKPKSNMKQIKPVLMRFGRDGKLEKDVDPNVVRKAAIAVEKSLGPVDMDDKQAVVGIDNKFEEFVKRDPDAAQVAKNPVMLAILRAEVMTKVISNSITKSIDKKKSDSTAKNEKRKMDTLREIESMLTQMNIKNPTGNYETMNINSEPKIIEIRIPKVLTMYDAIRNTNTLIGNLIKFISKKILPEVKKFIDAMKQSILSTYKGGKNLEKSTQNMSGHKTELDAMLDNIALQFNENKLELDKPMGDSSYEMFNIDKMTQSAKQQFINKIVDNCKKTESLMSDMDSTITMMNNVIGDSNKEGSLLYYSYTFDVDNPQTAKDAANYNINIDVYKRVLADKKVSFYDKVVKPISDRIQKCSARIKDERKLIFGDTKSGSYKEFGESLKKAKKLGLI